MNYFRLIYLLCGLALLVWVVTQTDLMVVWAHSRKLGWGLGVVLAIYFAAFLIDTLSWQLTFLTLGFGGSWGVHLWKVRMVGEAVNSATPFATIGGEPVKAVLLHRHYGMAYGESVASLVLARTTNLLALVVFVAVGFALMMDSAKLPQGYTASAGVGLAALSTGIVLFFLVQRFKVSSATGRWLARGRLGVWLDRALGQIHDLEDRLIRFYAGHRRRFAAALGLALVNWMVGTAELYATLWFLGRPVTIAEAWIIEAGAQLVRAATFFIPASIGAQEGAFLLLCGAITGQPALGLAVALVRRLREMVWILWGFALGWRYSSLAPLNNDPGEAPAETAPAGDEDQPR